MKFKTVILTLVSLVAAVTSFGQQYLVEVGGSITDRGPVPESIVSSGDLYTASFLVSPSVSGILDHDVLSSTFSSPGLSFNTTGGIVGYEQEFLGFFNFERLFIASNNVSPNLVYGIYEARSSSINFTSSSGPSDPFLLDSSTDPNDLGELLSFLETSYSDFDGVYWLNFPRRPGTGPGGALTLTGSIDSLTVTAVPEPSTFIGIAAASLGVFYFGRKRRKDAA